MSRKPDRKEITLTRLGRRALSSGVIESEDVTVHMGDEEGETDSIKKVTKKGRLDCSHPSQDFFAVCQGCIDGSEGKSYCKTCFYLFFRICPKHGPISHCCYRKSLLFSDKHVCKRCGSYVNPLPSFERKG